MDKFGYSVAIYGNYIIVGIPYDDEASTEAGTVYVYNLENGNFEFLQELTRSNPSDNDNFGYTVAIYGDYIVVGVPYDDINDDIKDNGSAYVYKLIDGVFEYHQKLLARNPNSEDHFGFSVAIYDNYIVVGVEDYDLNDGDNVIIDSGSVYVYELFNNYFEIKKILTKSNAIQNDKFGESVAIYGEYIVVGVPNDDVNAIENTGSVYVFEFNNINNYNYSLQYYDNNISLNGYTELISNSIDSDLYIYLNNIKNINASNKGYIYFNDNNFIFNNINYNSQLKENNYLSVLNNINFSNVYYKNNNNNLSSIYMKNDNIITNVIFYNRQEQGKIEIILQNLDKIFTNDNIKTTTGLNLLSYNNYKVNSFSTNNIKSFELNSDNDNLNLLNDYDILKFDEDYLQINKIINNNISIFNNNINEEFNKTSNNIVVNQYVGYDVIEDKPRYDFEKLRQMTGEHSDFLRFLKLRQPDLINKYSSSDMIINSDDNLSLLDKGLNYSVDTSVFNNDGTFNSNIFTKYIIPLKETVPNEYLGPGTSNANLRSDYYVISLGEPVFEATNNEEEIRNINTPPKGFTDVFMNDGDKSIIYNSQKPGFITFGEYNINSNSIIITSILNSNSYYQVDAIGGFKERKPGKPFLDLKPGNIIHISKNGSSINGTKANSSYLVTKVYENGLKVDFDPIYNSTTITGSYTETDLFKIEIADLNVSNSYQKGQIINERYNFANFSNINVEPEGADKLRTGTRQYIAISQYPILNYELNIEADPVKNFNNYMIPDWGFRPDTYNMSSYDETNVLVTMDFYYDGQLNHEPIILDKGSHILTIPTSNISETIASTNIFFVNSSETGEYTVEKELGDLDIFLLTTDISSGIDFTNFVNNQIINDPNNNFYFKVKTSLTYNITKTQLPCDRNYIESQHVLSEYDNGFYTYTSILSSNAIMSNDSINTDLSIFKSNNKIIVSRTLLNNNSFTISGIVPTSSCILINSNAGSVVVNETPEICILTNVILQQENGNSSYSGSQLVFNDINNTISLSSNPTDTTNMQNFTKNQEIVVYGSIYNNGEYIISSDYPNTTIISLTTEPKNETTSLASIYKKIYFKFIGHPIKTVLNDVKSIFHYQDAQGNNMMLGSFTGQFCGSKNLAIHNTYIGNKVGQTNHGSGNVFFGSETGLATKATDGESFYNNKFAVYKNNFIGIPDKPLIGGDFGSGRVGINTINPDNLLTSTLESNTKLIVNGAIRASSHTTFTGSHIITLSKDTNISDLIPGMILSSTGKINKLNITDTIVECELTNKEKDKKVFGVYSNFEKNDEELIYYAAGVGEGQIWVSNITGNVEAGDYVCSSKIPGYTQLQDDDLAHNYTVAKITEDVDWDKIKTYKYLDNVSHKVALLGCVYMCS